MSFLSVIPAVTSCKKFMTCAFFHYVPDKVSREGEVNNYKIPRIIFVLNETQITLTTSVLIRYNSVTFLSDNNKATSLCTFFTLMSHLKESWEIIKVVIIWTQTFWKMQMQAIVKQMIARRSAHCMVAFANYSDANCLCSNDYLSTTSFKFGIKIKKDLHLLFLRFVFFCFLHS